MGKAIIGIVGSGSMGIGIAQVAAMSGHSVVVYDVLESAVQKAQVQLQLQVNKLAEKAKISVTESIAIMGRIYFSNSLSACSDCNLIIEAIVEDLSTKKQLFGELQKIVSEDCILASNTSSLSISNLASSINKPDRFIGIHFFNPATVMPLVEVIPALQTNPKYTQEVIELMESWLKIPVQVKDSPGFIVNRIARPYYSEALRIYEEGLADFITIDYAMTSIYNFKMGPFALMDFIGNDVNFAVTKSVWESCFYEARYKPSITQRNLVSAGWYGRKSGKGFYDYSNSTQVVNSESPDVLRNIAWRILVLLINEAADAWYYKIASREAIEIAMTKGVNYPKGLLSWGEEIGIQHCVHFMNHLYENYKEERYRCSQGLIRMMS
ncbi:MAG: 3-hydroxybutyryl-CoA dehydrogenase [Saprospiraceae bacterium]|nr:3-hydroxybutyryl-CoA dehydrogenase [Saprospiraceae bacterium]